MGCGVPTKILSDSQVITELKDTSDERHLALQSALLTLADSPEKKALITDGKITVGDVRDVVDVCGSADEFGCNDVYAINGASYEKAHPKHAQYNNFLIALSRFDIELWQLPQVDDQECEAQTTAPDTQEKTKSKLEEWRNRE